MLRFVLLWPPGKEGRGEKQGDVREMKPARRTGRDTTVLGKRTGENDNGQAPPFRANPYLDCWGKKETTKTVPFEA